MPIEFSSPAPDVAAPSPYEEDILSYRQVRLRGPKVILGVVLSAAIGSCGVEMSLPAPLGEGRVPSFAEVHPDKPFPGKVKEAPAPDPDAVDLTEEWLADPTSTRLIDIDQTPQLLPDGRSMEPEDQLEARDRQSYLARQGVAAEFGLTIMDASDTLRALREDRDARKQMPFADYLATANGYLQGFGVTISHDTHDKYEEGFEANPQHVAKSSSARSIVEDIVQAFSRLPVEYVRDLGITKLLLVAQKPGTESDVTAYIYSAFDGPEGAAIVYNVDHPATLETTYHELWHRLDHLLSGGQSDTDRYFALLNGGAKYGGVDDDTVRARKDGYYTLGDFYAAFSKANRTFSDHIGKPDCTAAATAATARMQAVGAMTVFATDYAGQSDVVEHKADTGKYIAADDMYATMLNSWLPLISAQFKTELARLATYRARYAAYFIAISNHGLERKALTLTFFQDACAKVRQALAEAVK
jgi:hypothetical protein